MGAKKYVSTHPWIDFTLNLNRYPFPYETWILLGAAQSKCRHLSAIPLRPDGVKRLLQISLQKGIRATTAIEGNSLSEEEVSMIIQGRADLPKSKQYQQVEVENVLNVYNSIAKDIASDIPFEIDCEQIKRDNSTILAKLDNEGGGIPGEIRTHSVVVGSYRGAPPEDCEYLLSRLCDWLNEDWGFDEGNKIVEAILKAIMGHLYIAWIHPFADGNGRTARALELRILMAAGVPMNAAHLLSNHYNETRPRYYASLSRTSYGGHGDPVPFIAYATQGLVDALDGQIGIVLEEQLKIIWEDHVYKSFSKETSRVKIRQRDLLLEISRHNEFLEPTEIRMRLGDKLLMEYSNSVKMFRRDVNALLKRGLLSKEGTKVRASKDLLLDLFPVSKRRVGDKI